MSSISTCSCASAGEQMPAAARTVARSIRLTIACLLKTRVPPRAAQREQDQPRLRQAQVPAGFGTLAKHDRTHHSLKSPACSYANEILSLLCREQKNHSPPLVKYWEIIADNLSKAAWTWGCISAVDSGGRTIFVADAHRGAPESVSLCVRMKS